MMVTTVVESTCPAVVQLLLTVCVSLTDSHQSVRHITTTIDSENEPPLTLDL